MASLLRRLSRRPVATHHLDSVAAPTSQLFRLPMVSLDFPYLLPFPTLNAVGPAHLASLLDALSSLHTTLSFLHSALTSTSALPAAPQGVPRVLRQSPHLLPQCADEIVCLLDVCNALKQVADHLYRRVGRLDHALQSLEEALQVVPSCSCSSSSFSSSSFSSSFSSSSATSSSTARQLQRTSKWRLRRVARRVSACLENERMSNTELNKAIEETRGFLISARNGLRRMAPPKETTDQMADGLLLSQAVHGTALTTLLILAAVLSSLAPRGKNIISRSCRFTKMVSLKKAAPLTRLQQGLLQAEKSNTNVVFKDLQDLHSSAAKLLLSINESLEGEFATGGDYQPAVEVKRMRKSAQALQEGLLNLGGDMWRLFQALLDLCAALLDAPAADAAS